MEYKVILNDFEGPLDLLLHLIKQSNISIYDISIDQITKQYMDYMIMMMKSMKSMTMKNMKNTMKNMTIMKMNMKKIDVKN